MALKTLSICSFSYFDKSWDAMKAYVACCNLDVALKLVKFWRELMAMSVETAALPAWLAFSNHGCLRASSADGLLFWSRVRSLEMKSLH